MNRGVNSSRYTGNPHGSRLSWVEKREVDVGGARRAQIDQRLHLLAAIACSVFSGSLLSMSGHVDHLRSGEVEQRSRERDRNLTNRAQCVCRGSILQIAPHDLWRMFAKLAHKGHAALEQIQISLGHASIQTTERYLGIEQDLTDAPCDHLGLRV